MHVGKLYKQLRINSKVKASTIESYTFAISPKNTGTVETALSSEPALLILFMLLDIGAEILLLGGIFVYVCVFKWGTDSIVLVYSMGRF